MTAPRLKSAAAAVVLLAALVGGATFYAERTAARYVHTLAPQMFPEKHRGLLLQRAALRQRDLLPLYGSSELNVANGYHASALFRDYPTGFTVFPVGSAGSTSLVWLQALAAIGDDVRGRKVAVSVAARAFTADGADDHAYAANFSRLHANALAFSPHLGFALKQEAARRMLQYPETLADDPLLTFALEQLAGGSPVGRVLYYASLPLGALQTALLRLQDTWATFDFLRRQTGIGSGPRRTADLDWDLMLERAEQESRRRADGNPFGFEATFWEAHAADVVRQRHMSSSEGVHTGLSRSAEWTDLDLLLRAIRDLGGEPLLLATPINGSYYDFLGIPSSTRQIDYTHVREIAEAHAVPLADFADHDTDKHFTVDPMFHLSGKGWVFYGRALDAFFNNRPLDPM